MDEDPVPDERAADARRLPATPSGADEHDHERSHHEARRNPAVVVLVAVLGFYRRFVSPLFPPVCRFYPSCSAYAVGALTEHGLLRGTGLTLVRVAKCAPWHPGGLDPVPPRERGRADRARDGARRSRTADPGTGAPTTEEQASC